MNITIIVPTSGRPAVVARLLSLLERQTRQPDHVIVSATSPRDIGDIGDLGFKVSCVYGEPGLCAQRNRGLSLRDPQTDIVVFFDDDFVPAGSYLERLAQAFEEHPDYVVITGNVLADGACGPGLGYDEALALLANPRISLASPPRVEDRESAYGCNMSIRARIIGERRFDERLPLYGWQEDTDFTSQLRAHGQIVFLENLLGVHLGTKGGRVSGVRLGYSQIVNPVYLIGKGTMKRWYGLRLICRNLAANLVKSLRPEPYIDRRGRLKGNLIGFVHLLTRRADTEHILKL
ncbi:glycosyltransferase family 2 protein [Ancylobacter mangrovi]|uniref:glycosyltransferase family 2 protein n=1 Tax=Ancylobacter mangrovi TaxID=2972472 RepID=UPI0021616AB0|nr:glycosyltransferase family 2 protein [Ancylobacter mangrovi]MCS0501270.1 glycosyltransferase [Ancylobacter mangrovi]